MCSRGWLILALAACALASACSQYNTNLSIQTSSSALSFVSPATATAGSRGFTITANGAGFVSNAIIEWNGSDLTTSYVSSLQLTATVPATNLTTPGTVQIAVKVPGSASSGTSTTNNTTTTEISNIVLFTVNSEQGPIPMIGSISPASAPFCSSPNGFTLTVNAASGSTFASDSLVVWNGSLRTTTFVNSSQLTAAILPVDTASSATATVAVTNSSGPSKGVAFTVTAPASNLAAPQPVSMLTPASALAGSSAVTVKVMGGSYLPCSVVQWNGTALVTAYVSATELDAVIPASNLLTAGSAQISVFTPAPGGGTSSAATFTIAPPTAPTITSLSASTTMSASTPACSPASFTLTVNGSNFVNGSSVVNWNGSPLINSTTFVSATQLTAVIPYTNTLAQGPVPITVSNGSALSNPVNFSVTAPSSLSPPTANSLSPSNAAAGSGLAVPLVVTGANFVPCSVINWAGSARTTNYLSPTQLSTSISPADIASVAQVAVTVFTPGSGGGTSAPLTFTVAGPTITSLSASTTAMASTPSCSASGLTLTVIGTNFVPGLVVSWNGSPRTPTIFISATQMSAPISAADTAFLATGAAAPAITVSNATLISNSSKFSLTTPTSATSPPQPTIASLMPRTAAVETAAGPAILLTVTGSNLFPCSAVYWNGSAAANALPTTVFIGPTVINTLIPVTNLTATGNNQVTVVSPASLGGTSSSSAFQVYSPSSPISTSPAGIGGALSLPLMSADQRYGVYVLASTDGTNENPGATKNIFVADTCQGVASGCTPSNTLVSIGLSSNPADGDSVSPSISADGRYVAFLSSATNLVSSDTNGVADVFVRDTCAGAPAGCTPSTQRVSVATNATQASGASTSATISPTGRYITFLSAATNLAAGTPSSGGVFLRDTCAGVAAGCTPSTQLLSAQ